MNFKNQKNEDFSRRIKDFSNLIKLIKEDKKYKLVSEIKYQEGWPRNI